MPVWSKTPTKYLTLKTQADGFLAARLIFIEIKNVDVRLTVLVYDHTPGAQHNCVRTSTYRRCCLGSVIPPQEFV